jgi:hypothetical protein
MDLSRFWAPVADGDLRWTGYYTRLNLAHKVAESPITDGITKSASRRAE